MKSTRILTFSALMSALSVVILLLGSLIDIIDMAMAVTASLILVVVHEELKFKSVFVFLVTSVIALFIVPNKLIVAEYALVAFYPIVKAFIEKLPKVFSIILKGLYFVLSSALIVYLFNVLFVVEEMIYMDIAYFVCMMAIFILLEKLIFRFTMYYRFKLRHQLKIDKFFL
ncbi:MAG: hypothetical protein J6K52_05170 [Clostridia bacterium]|nr:hypothetical protein [Clostridia bacterium]